MFKLKPIDSILNKKSANSTLPRWRTPIASWALTGTVATFAIGTALPLTGLAATIQGNVFMDWNDNGIKDTWELPLTTPKSILFIRHDATADAGQGGFYSTETGADGTYTFNSPHTGQHTIWSSMGWGWRQTTPAQGEGIAFYQFTLANSATATINFGLYDPIEANNNNAPVIKADDQQVKVTLGDSLTLARQFTDADANDRHYVEWNFGDGNKQSELLPTKTYSSSATYTYTARGTYTVTFKVTDTKGATTSTTIQVTVEAPPIVKLGDDIALDVGEAFNFTGGFTDPDGKPRYDYLWKFGDGNTSVGKTFKEKTLDVDHTFNAPGEYTVTLEVSDKNGNKGSDTLIVNVRGVNTDPCATGVATIRSKAPWGNWDSASTWAEKRVPGKNDWVLIQGGHNIILPSAISSSSLQLQVKGLCIAQNGVLQGAFNALNLPPSWINLNAASVHNYGKIQSAFGVNGGLLGGSYQHATSGGSIKFFVYKFINDGEMLAHGRGGDDILHLYYSHESGVSGQGGNGGQIEIYPAIMISNGKIQGGQGGTADGVRDASYFVVGNMYGGNGGGVRVMATDLNNSKIAGQVIGGCGGNADGRSTESVVPGLGGSIFLNVGTMAGKAAVCPGVKTVIQPHHQPIYQRQCKRFLFWKYSCRYVLVGYRFIGWDPTLLKATNDTRFEDLDHLDIFGPEDAIIDLTELAEGAITAEESITIKVDQNGVIELPPAERGNVFKTPKIEVFADQIRQNGKTLTATEAKAALQTLAETAEITIAPSKATYSAGFSYQDHLVGEPNAVVPVKLTLLNLSSHDDTYTITVTDTAGWEMEGLPETIKVNGQRRSDLIMNVNLPATRGEENTLTITAVSQGDSEMSTEAEIRLGVIEEELITPRIESDAKADLTLIIDDSQVMASEILNVANALETFLSANTETGKQLTIELITFKDEVVSRVVTTEVGEIIGRIRSLRPADGGDCANASVAALESALPHLNPNGQIVLATAAPPHQDASQIIAQAQQQQVKINVLLAGTCGDETSDKALYQNIATQTGGTFQWLQRGVTDEVTLKEIVSNVVTDAVEETITIKEQSNDGNDTTDDETGNDDSGNGDTGSNDSGNGDNSNTGGENAGNDQTGNSNPDDNNPGNNETGNNDTGGNDDSGTTVEKPTAQYRIYGTIHNKLGKPLANVTLKLGDKTATTDANGNWEIVNLPEGEYTLTPSKPGYSFPTQAVALGNDEFNRKMMIKPLSALEVMVVIEPHSPKLGENVTYTITVTNGGAQTATGVVLTQTLPEGTILVSLTAMDGGDCNKDTLTCTLPDLTTGNTAKVQLIVGNTQEDKRLQMTATLTSNEYPTDVQVKQTPVTAYLSVATACSPKTIMPQGELNCTATVQLSEYAPSPATGVELTVTLPQGVQLNNETLDNRCVSDTPTTFTCALEDLSIASQTIVNFTETLQDPGLLLLTNEAQVSANEYPVVIDRARTKIYIPPEYQVDMVLVIDITGSMQEEKLGTQEALIAFVKQRDATQFPLSALIVFRDEVTVTAVTKDMNMLIDAIEDMEVSGGGMCPEASAEALEVAIRHVKMGGTIVLVTDASPYDDADLVGITNALKEKAIDFHPFVTGDCSDKDSWNVLPNQQ
jgi:uncharacterized repeat protein (TIGR01451 family)